MRDLRSRPFVLDPCWVHDREVAVNARGRWCPPEAWDRGGPPLDGFVLGWLGPGMLVSDGDGTCRVTPARWLGC